MESALYGIFTRVGEVSEIERVSAANEWDFWYKTNSCENPVRTRFPFWLMLLTSLGWFSIWLANLVELVKIAVRNLSGDIVDVLHRIVETHLREKETSGPTVYKYSFDFCPNWPVIGCFSLSGSVHSVKPNNKVCLEKNV